MEKHWPREAFEIPRRLHYCLHLKWKRYRSDTLNTTTLKRAIHLTLNLAIAFHKKSLIVC